MATSEPRPEPPPATTTATTVASSERASCPVVSHAPSIVVGCGDTGPLVIEVQRLLDCELYDVSVDGVFGPATYRAVVEYQREHGFAADGLVGPLTYDTLQYSCDGFGDD